MWSSEAIARAATLACRLEAGAAKPGNVTPTSAFPEMSYRDFLASADAVGPVMGAAVGRGVGETILRAVEATRVVARANTNLGTVLLLAPLAKGAVVTAGGSRAGGAVGSRASRAALRDSVTGVLEDLDLEDAELAYRAIRLAAPGGMGWVGWQDVSNPPSVTLLEAMRSAAKRDTVAREYATDFDITFSTGLRLLEAALIDASSIAAATLELYLGLLSAIPDSLVARKFGAAAAREASDRAAAALEAGPGGSPERALAVEAFDVWLRGPERGWNPGTTADLVASTLFVWLLTSGSGADLTASGPDDTASGPRSGSGGAAPARG